MTTTIDKRATGPQGAVIFFNAKSHLYWSTCGGGPHPDESLAVQYTPVTAFVSRFFPAFDEGAAAVRAAKKRNTTPEAVISEWAYIRNAAARAGTRVHEVCEDCILGNPPRHSPESESERKMFAAAWDTASKVKSSLTVLCAEQIIFHAAARIAGTVDLCARDGGGTLWILDWKTNKEIRRASPYGEAALFPVEHMPVCELSKYELQLSAYEMILRSQRYVPDGTPVRRALIHIREGGAETIECRDRSREVAEMLTEKLTSPPF